MPRKKKIQETEETEPETESKPVYKKISETKAPDVLLHHMQPPPKPSGPETRLYQVTTKGNNEKGVNVVTGTLKKWLTKDEAKEHGLPWAD